MLQFFLYFYNDHTLEGMISFSNTVEKCGLLLIQTYTTIFVTASLAQDFFLTLHIFS